MTRTEHLAWCKQRALQLVSEGDATGAVASMASDMAKHPENAPCLADKPNSTEVRYEQWRRVLRLFLRLCRKEEVSRPHWLSTPTKPVLRQMKWASLDLTNTPRSARNPRRT